MFDEVFESILSQQVKNDFIYPFYERYCISNIPKLILDFFNIKQKNTSNIPGLDVSLKEKSVNKIILFILDGFGLNQFSYYNKKSDFFQQFTKRGMVFPITSIFPSQTTNALATLNTGLTPQEHGLFEYFLYLKETDMLINTFHFEPIILENQEFFQEKGFNIDLLFNGKTIHHTLKENDIQPFCHMYIRDAYSACSKLFCDGSVIVPSLKASDLILNLRKNLKKTQGPAYFFVHLGNLDTIAHQYGPQSEEYYTELSILISLLKNHLIDKLDNKTSRETVLLLTSDHGELDVIPESTTYLNHFPELMQSLQHNKRGYPILPTGSPRDIFLHVKKERLYDTQQFLIQKIGKKAEIIKANNAIKNELFGIGKIKKEFLERVGDLLVLPYGNETIWFEHFKNRKFTSLGHHGGLNKNEMLVPFMLSRLSLLK